jgi:hypothetical protein
MLGSRSRSDEDKGEKRRSVLDVLLVQVFIVHELFDIAESGRETGHHKQERVRIP